MIDLDLKGTMEQTVQLIGKMQVPQSFGTSDHRELSGRDAPDQHPVEAITGLRLELDGKQNEIEFMSNMDIQKILDS